ncbi:Crp/Fnr family transcriptional regulator [Wenyingzhuangia sp. IMCC45533]
MEKLIELFNAIKPLSQKEIEILTSRLNVESIAKNTVFSKRGVICKKLSFVVSGIFKVTKIDEKGNNYIPYFITQNHFAVDIHSFSNNSISDEEITCVSHAEIITISKDHFLLFEKEIPNFTAIISTLKEKALIEKIKLKSEMLVDNAVTKYNKLLTRHPEIIKYVSQNEISQHLGITPYTLSRIKSKK